MPEITDQTIISALRQRSLDPQQLQQFTSNLLEEVSTVDHTPHKRQITVPTKEFGDVVVNVYGNKGTPLMLLQDMGVTGQLYHKSAEYLSAYYKVIIPELPPFLHRLRDLWEVYKNAEDVLSEYVGFVTEVKNYLQLEQLTLLGHGYGGALAVKYASDNPSFVSKLILINPAAMPMRVTAVKGFMRNFSSIMDYLKHNDKVPFYLLPNFFRNFRDILFTYKILFNLNLSRDIRKIEVVTDIYWGENDSIAPVEQARHLAQLMGKANLTIIPGRNRTWVCDSPQNIHP